MAYSPKHVLAHYALTGGADQLAKVVELSKELDAEFIAKTAVYARENASMNDMPALLLAVLSTKSPEYLRRVFDRVIDNGRMLRTFVQIIRSGAVGRKSLGSAPKALVQKWLSSAVFNVANAFAAGELSPEQWIEKIEEVVI